MSASPTSPCSALPVARHYLSLFVPTLFSVLLLIISTLRNEHSEWTFFFPFCCRLASLQAAWYCVALHCIAPG